jgi:phospholipase/carboxylesterase
VEDLVIRTEELARFVEGAIRTYALDPQAIVAVGFSNGANIATSVLLRRPGLLRGAVLLSPMLPYDPDTRPDLTGTSVFIGAGRADRIAPPEQADRVSDLLRRCRADVTVHWHSAGHTVTDAEIAAARHWLETHALRPSAKPVVP